MTTTPFTLTPAMVRLVATISQQAGRLDASLPAVPDATGAQRAISDVVAETPRLDRPVENLEYYVRVDWIKPLPLDQSIKEKGFFGNQNSVAKPKAKRWIHTIDRLKNVLR